MPHCSRCEETPQPGNATRPRGRRGRARPARHAVSVSAWLLAAAFGVLAMAGAPRVARCAEDLTSGEAPGEASPTLVITGPHLIDVGTVEKWIGRAPSKLEAREKWANKAALKIAKKYHRRGYDYARAWHRVDPNTGVVEIYVDEGRMHRIAFRGVNVVSALMYRVDIDLPDDVYHKATVDEIIDEIVRKHGFRNLFFRVRDSPELEVTPLNDAVPQRELTFFVLSQGTSGYGFSARLDGSRGLVPSASIRGYDVVLDEDRASASAEIGIPYRQYAFEEAPRWRWVYGELDLAYRTPRFASVLAMRVDGEFSLERQSRRDLALEAYLVSTNVGLLSLQLVFDMMEFSLGGGVSHSELFFVEGATEPVTDYIAVRGIARARADFELSKALWRRDQADELSVIATYGAGMDDATGSILDIYATSQFVFYPWFFDIILQQRAFSILGDVHLWEERNLSGSYMRVYFGRYVRHAAQLDAQLRFPLRGENFMGGVWYDYSVFGEPDLQGETVLGQAHAVGPSLNFVFFDFIALDVYYGLGWAPEFAHNLYLKAAMIY